MPTLEEVRAKIQRNMPKETQSAKPKRLEWDRETAQTIVSACGTYRISRMEDPHNPGIYGFGLWLAPTPTSASKHLSGPYFTAKDARDAAQAHVNGEPLQAHLS